MELTRYAQAAIAQIVKAGGRPLLVGGCVRDMLLDLPSKDIDIEVHGDVTVEAIEASLREAGRVDVVGKSFGVLKFGPADQAVDVSFPRRDSKVGSGHTGFVVTFDRTMTVKEALSRRDFTINSIAYDPMTTEIIDPFDGVTDILRKRIRHTSDAFADDPLRVLRAVQFAARFGFKIDSETAKLCETLRYEFYDISVERVWVEWEKITSKGKSFTDAVEALVATGWIEHFPELHEASAGWADRIIEIADKQGVGAERRAAMAIAAAFVGQEEALQKFLSRIDAPRPMRKHARRLARFDYETSRETHARVRQLARQLGKVKLRDWLTVHSFAPHDPFWLIAESEGVLDAAARPLLTGSVLIEHGWTPGPVFAPVLAEALAAQDEEGWTTVEQAEAWLASRSHVSE